MADWCGKGIEGTENGLRDVTGCGGGTGNGKEWSAKYSETLS